jgi:FtsP/CotA-like multicopper oxidase with cupredoxin domain
VLAAKRGGDYGISWTLNDRVYGEDSPAHMKLGRWVKVRFANNSGRLHPMHLHGVFFRVLARNGEPALEPHFRDTVLVRPRETVDVGMIPGDAGRWALHCHILEHAEAGMMTTFVVSEEDGHVEAVD